MPKIRTLTIVSQTSSLITFEDPRTLKPVLATIDEAGIPTAVEVDGTPLDYIGITDDRRTFVGTVEGMQWQIDLFGTGEEMTGRATTRS